MFTIIETAQNYFTCELLLTLSAVKWHFTVAQISGGHVWW